MRETVQAKLNELTDIDSGNFKPENIIEVGTTYFGYTIDENYQSQDFDKNEVLRVSIIGFVIRKIRPTENTLSIVDAAAALIKNKLKELNFKIGIQDVTLSDDIRKIKITGYVLLDKTNNKLVL